MTLKQTIREILAEREAAEGEARPAGIRRRSRLGRSMEALRQACVGYGSSLFDATLLDQLRAYDPALAEVAIVKVGL
jgi:hypothetical protein